MGGQPEAASRNATTALVLGILGVICCPICAFPAFFMGKGEVQRVDAGASPAAGRSQAQIGMILGIVGMIFFVLQLLWIFLMGGLTVLSAIVGGGQ